MGEFSVSAGRVRTEMESFYGTVLTFVRTLDEIVNKYEAAERRNLDIATRRNY